MKLEVRMSNSLMIRPDAESAAKCCGLQKAVRFLLRVTAALLFAGLGPLNSRANAEDIRRKASHEERLPVLLNDRVNDWHKLMSAAIADPFDRVDRFFGDESIADEGRRTRLRIGAGVRTDVVDGWRMVTDFSLRLVLPRIEERWQLFLDELAGEDEFDGLSDLTSPPVDTDPDIGLRYFLLRNLRTSISADAGYRFGSPNQAFGRLRGRARYPRGLWSLDLTQTGTYFTKDGWRSQSDMSWTLPFASAYGVRSFSRLTWEEISSGYTPEQRFSLYRTLTYRRAWRVEGRGIWVEMPNPSEIVYTFEFVYRQLIHQNWLFMEIAPGVEYAESRDYDANPFAMIKFEILFNAD